MPNRKELDARAAELGLTVPEDATNKEREKLVKDREAELANAPSGERGGGNPDSGPQRQQGSAKTGQEAAQGDYELTALTRIDHDGKSYGPGDTLTVSTQDRAALIAAKAVTDTSV